MSAFPPPGFTSPGFDGAATPREPYALAPPPDGAALYPTPPTGYTPVQTERVTTVGEDYFAGHIGAREAAQPSQPWMFPGTEDVNPTEVFAQPGYTSPRSPASVLARISVIAAVFGMIPGVSVVACISGHLALREISVSYKSGRGLALAGLTLGYIGVALWLLFWIVWSLAN